MVHSHLHIPVEFISNSEGGYQSVRYSDLTACWIVHTFTARLREITVYTNFYNVNYHDIFAFQLVSYAHT